MHEAAGNGFDREIAGGGVEYLWRRPAIAAKREHQGGRREGDTHACCNHCRDNLPLGRKVSVIGRSFKRQRPVSGRMDSCGRDKSLSMNRGAAMELRLLLKTRTFAFTHDLRAITGQRGITLKIANAIALKSWGGGPS
jgi:hypothetical protein